MGVWSVNIIRQMNFLRPLTKLLAGPYDSVTAMSLTLLRSLALVPNSCLKTKMWIM